MSRRKFLTDYRTEIDTAIRSKCSNIGTLCDSERWVWILNDESLYRFAKSVGVKV